MSSNPSDKRKNNNNNRWKFLSFALMGILALGVTAATALPQAIAAPSSDKGGEGLKMLVVQIRDIMLDVQTKVDSQNSTVNANLDATVSSRASQTSVDNLQDAAKIIDAKVSAIQTGGGSGGAMCVTIDVNRDGSLDEFEISPRPHPGVNWAGCDLYQAQLRGAGLPSADLSNAELHLADLTEADLSNANLSGADFSSASLFDADLANADLSNADLAFADLRDADLTGADFTGAITTGCLGCPT